MMRSISEPSNPPSRRHRARVGAVSTDLIPRVVVLLLALLPLLPLAGCAPAEEEAPNGASAGPQPVESPEAGILLTDVPEGFRLVSAEGGEIVLERKPELPPGTAVVSATEEQRAGVNLVQAVKEQKEEIESRPEGRFQGQTELGSHLGPAYLSRGRWMDEGTEREEMRIFSLHPNRNAMVVITYTYPITGDTKDRATQIMDVLSLVEGLSSAPEGGTEPGSGAEQGEADSGATGSAAEAPEGGQP